MLLTSHLSYPNINKTQLEWEVNMTLVYGLKRVSYFTFYLSQGLLDQGWRNSCIDCNLKKYQHYDDVKEISEWLMPLGTELYGKTSTAVFHVCDENSLESQCTAYTSYGDLGEISGEDLVIGFFDDNSFMIVNRRFEEKGANRTVVFKDITRGLQYFDPTSSSWKDAEADGIAVRNSSGYLSIKLPAGNGWLLRVADAS